MRVKVGNDWFEVTPALPIMVELTDKDKENIANMAEGATRYAIFDTDTKMTPDAMRQWMDEGSRHADTGNMTLLLDEEPNKQ